MINKTRKTPRFHDGMTGAALAVRVTTRAPHNEVVAIQEDGTLKVRLAAVPLQGKANHALISFLADILGISPGKIELVAGQTGRNKLVTITGLTSAEIHQRILDAIKAQ
ncbi:MAG: DUF167 domain-containing protein [Anaerolineaceae bacterium]|nr:DUF167 domain-containing protein [Anaerolineaceae bacterium]MBN2676732.1 DUF167 domain-containing protein [Anaerolineaceae bacterium]